MNTSSVEKKKVLIAEDHPLVRFGLTDIISKQQDMEVLAAVDNAMDALALVKQSAPDLAIIDISLADSSGLELVRAIRDWQRQQGVVRTRVLVLSAHDEKLFAPRAFEAGANGYVSKDTDLEQLVCAMFSVLRGETHVSEEMKQRMAKESSGDVIAEDIYYLNPSRLSDRELEVFRLIGKGMTTSSIASHLALSVKTVESHQANIKRKLCLISSTELVRFATQWDFTQK